MKKVTFLSSCWMLKAYNWRKMWYNSMTVFREQLKHSNGSTMPIENEKTVYPSAI